MIEAGGKKRRTWSLHQIRWWAMTAIALVFTLGGNTMTLVSLNFWVNVFPASSNSSASSSNGVHSGAQFAIQFVSAAVYCAFFAVSVAISAFLYGPRFVLRCALGRPDYPAVMVTVRDCGTPSALYVSPAKSDDRAEVPYVAFNATDESAGDGGDFGERDERLAPCQTTWIPLRRRVWFRRMLVAAGMGLTDLSSTLLALYATPATSETMQAVLQGTICFWALGISWLVVDGQRGHKYCTWTLLLSMLFAAGAVGISAIGTSNVGGQVAWTCVFAASAVVYAGWCILQRVFCDLDLPLPGAVTEAADNDAARRHAVATAAVSKLIMLLGDCVFQLLFTVALLPVDAIPWFGSSASVRDSFLAFGDGLRCVASCPGSAAFATIYCVGYIVSYIGSACLNHYSPTLNSIVIQLSAPATALVLVVAPRWNISGGGPVVWYQQLGAAALLAASALLFYRWESTDGSHGSAEPVIGEALVVGLQ